MKKSIFDLAGLFLLGLLACNSAPDQAAETEDSAAADTPDTSHGHMGTSGVQALPAIPAGATVSFKNLKNGQTLSSPVKIEMGAENIQVDSAGAIRESSGHHHLLINAGDSMMAGEVIPMDSSHMHFGKAQKQAEVKLPAGKHKLTLQFADGIHRSYGGRLASTVTIVVK